MNGSRSPARVAAGSVLAGACLVAVAMAVPRGEGSTFPARRSVLQSVPQAPSPSRGTLPVVAEHRYRIAAKIRPLVLFWIGRDNVGGARIRWRRGDQDARGYDLLIGSDPARAPRHVNRWGFILEEAHPGGATVVGVMKQSNEESLDEAKSHVAGEARGGVVFKMIQATVDQAKSVANVTIATLPRDYSYRELGPLIEVLSKEPAPPKVRTTPVPPGGRIGLVTGIAELLHDAVESVKRTGKAPGKKSVAYAYYEKQYDVTRASSAIETNVTYGGVAYPKLLKSDFDVRARGESWVETFTVIFGIDGRMAEVPVFVTYQPRWWFKVEMVLDEREVF
jgi:hypothetical protein